VLRMSLLLVSHVFSRFGVRLMIGLGGRNRKVAEAYVTQKKVRPQQLPRGELTDSHSRSWRRIC
jgi:tartrate dehydratase beta subunit/fumarate hydratase class I family protein